MEISNLIVLTLPVHHSREGLGNLQS